jgi:hypothetical protein
MRSSLAVLTYLAFGLVACGDSEQPRSTATRDQAGAPSKDRTVRFAVPRGFVRGKAVPARGIVASAVMDRRNAIIVSQFGPQEVPPGELRRALATKLRSAGVSTPVRVERHQGISMPSITLDRFRSTNEIAGERVGAKRLYFSAVGRVWEVSCQFALARRSAVLRACDEVASTIKL